MKLNVGTSGFSYKAWKGSFYLPGLPDKRMLRAYAERLPAVEINSSFRRLPTLSALENWASQVPADFEFSLKAPQQITHVLRLSEAEASVAQLMEVAAALKQRLGPLLFQLPPWMKKDLPTLRDFLALLNPSYRVAFEFRHESWFDDSVFELLRAHRTALCIADAPGALVVPLVRTAPWAYLRLRRPDYDDAALSAWLGRLHDQGWDEASVFFRHDDDGRAPAMALRLLELSREPPRRCPTEVR